MAATLSSLVPEFRTKAEQLIENCFARGVEMRPYFAIRTPKEQGALWRQSRSYEEVIAKIRELRAQGCDYIANAIELAGAQHGPHVTNAIPGLSWHQWGEACDFFWVVDGKANWSTDQIINGLNGYKVLAEEAAKLGMDAGGLWNSFKDWPHVQLRSASSPLKIMSLKDIDNEMVKLYRK